LKAHNRKNFHLEHSPIVMRLISIRVDCHFYRMLQRSRSANVLSGAIDQLHIVVSAEFGSIAMRIGIEYNDASKAADVNWYSRCQLESCF
jgi:hypothetical protein